MNLERDEATANRIAEALSAIGQSKSEFARSIGSSPSYISEVCLAKRPASTRVLKGLVSLGVSARWVLMGEGEMLDGAGSPEAANPPVQHDEERSYIATVGSWSQQEVKRRDYELSAPALVALVGRMAEDAGVLDDPVLLLSQLRQSDLSGAKVQIVVQLMTALLKLK